MAEPGSEIDAVMELARSNVEVAIARYRVVVTGILIASSAAGLAVGTFGTGIARLLPLGYSVLYCAVAVGIVLLLRGRALAPNWLSIGAMVFDIASAPLCFAFVPSSAYGSMSADLGAHWAMYATTANVCCTFALTLLRPSKAAALISSATALAVFFGTQLYQVGFQPPQLLVGTDLLAMAAVAWFSASRQRKNVELFARHTLLTRFLPPAAAHRVLHQGASALELGGTHQWVTMIATDLRGFTTMSEAMAPEQVVAELNAYHGAMVEQIDAHGGALDKFIGDGALAVFGLDPSGKAASPDAGAAQAVACARAMLATLDRLNASRTQANRPPLRMGIGVHTGPVVAGSIGAPQRRLEFTVIGDAVNTASRLESATKELGVEALVSAECARRLASTAGLEPHAPVHLKGKQEAVELFVLRRDAGEPGVAVARG